MTFAYFVWRAEGTRYSATESDSTIDVVYEGGQKDKINKMRECKVDGTYGTQLAKERAEIGATRIAELFFEEIEVDEDVRYCVFVYLLDGSIREEVL